jgi:hypothetical protein
LGCELVCSFVSKVLNVGFGAVYLVKTGLELGEDVGHDGDRSFRCASYVAKK